MNYRCGKKLFKIDFWVLSLRFSVRFSIDMVWLISGPTFRNYRQGALDYVTLKMFVYGN